MLKDPNNISLSDDQQNEFSSQNDVDGSVKDILEPMLENKDNDSLSAILSEIDHHSQKHKNTKITSLQNLLHHLFHLHLTAPLAHHQIIPQYPQMIIHTMKQMKIQIGRAHV